MTGQSALQLALTEQWEELRRRNGRFSLRAYAQRLKMSPGALSAVLGGKRRVSVKMAQKIVEKMNLSPEKRAAVDASFLKGAKISAVTAERLKKELVLQDDQFKLISDGLHFSLLSLLETKNCKFDLEWLARRLNVSPTHIEKSLERLKRLKLVKETRSKKLKITGAEIKTTDNIASLAIRRYHEDRFDEAKQKIHSVPVNQRDFNSVTIAVDSRRLDEAKILIRDFKERMKDLLTKGTKDEVYRLNIQLYPVTEIKTYGVNK